MYIKCLHADGMNSIHKSFRFVNKVALKRTLAMLALHNRMEWLR